MALPSSNESEPTLWQWLPKFFRQELALYPGRWSTVARIVIAAVLSMIIIVTLRIPYGAPGVLVAFLLSRENLVSTAKSGFYFLVAFSVWIVLLPVGARMFASEPLTHFLWEGATAFLCFFFLKAFTYFPLATGLAVAATSAMTIWYLPGPAEQNVELTLWQIPSTAVGVVITLAVEVVFRHFKPRRRLADDLADRLKSIEAVVQCYVEGSPAPPSAIQSVTQYAIAGTSSLRAQVAQDSSNEIARLRSGALIALIGRGVDIVAAMVSNNQQGESIPPDRAAVLRDRISRLREQILGGGTGAALQTEAVPAQDPPRLHDLESCISLMESVLATGLPANLQSGLVDEGKQAKALVVKDAFSNPEYVRFAFAGTAASMLCYVIYVGLNWPGISTAVTTCALTALSDIGTSRQKQLLRLTGACIGAFVFGLGSQVFILPYIDSIVGLTVLFACITGISAYIATSSPRLSYAGLQMAFAFYLINFTDFTVPLNLTIGRDRAVGVLLGVVSMWLVFERFYPRPSAVQMVKLFAQSARSVARLNCVTLSGTDSIQVEALREQMSGIFASINAEADAVLFEAGGRRSPALAARDRVRRWLSALRTIYLLDLPQLPLLPHQEGREVLPPIKGSEEDSTNQISAALLRIAAHLEDQIVSKPTRSPSGMSSENELAQVKRAGTPLVSEPGSSTPPLELLRWLVAELERDVFREPVFDPPA